MVISRLIFAGIATLLVMSADAGISLSATRIVIDAGRQDSSLTVRNTGAEPFLAQSWLQSNEDDSDVSVPEFWITPPVVRIEGGREALLKVIPLDVSKLPKDRESVFYLNVQQIPQSNNAAPNKLVLAIRQRIKVFFRPAELQGDPDHAPDLIQWKLTRRSDKSFEIEAANVSPFHISFAQISVNSKEHVLGKSDSFMLKPRETRVLNIAAADGDKMLAPAEIRYSTINDFGAVYDHVFQITDTGAHH